ncbi:hypothetical protein HanIR_Chr11g0505401 [Helianthus annuus]|nr:hypothetical protein HanIR_Chr11g0505401 [Helianthus annuus]
MSLEAKKGRRQQWDLIYLVEKMIEGARQKREVFPIFPNSWFSKIQSFRVHGRT